MCEYRFQNMHSRTQVVSTMFDSCKDEIRCQSKTFSNSMLAQPFVDVINLEVSLMTAQQGRNFFFCDADGFGVEAWTENLFSDLRESWTLAGFLAEDFGHAAARRQKAILALVSCALLTQQSCEETRRIVLQHYR